MKLIIYFILLFAFVLNSNSIDFNTLEDKVSYYKTIFDVNCLNEKITNNKGDGNDSLYGTRNMKPVLHGIAYRGGANNFYHKDSKRDNHNPLPEDGLTNLCKYGFSEAVYLYQTNFKESEKEFTVNNNTLEYTQNSLNTPNEIKNMLLKVKEIIDNPMEGPIYLHCWNGWHQSGFAGATILMQFCDFTNLMAYEYWMENTDGVNKGYENVKNRVKLFKPFDDIKIDKKTKKLICPCINKGKTE